MTSCYQVHGNHEPCMYFILPFILSFVFQIFCFWLSQNPIKSGKDKVTYHEQLCNLFKEKFGEPFCFLPCYLFLCDKPKFLSLLSDNKVGNDDKRSIGSKDEQPVGNKHAKHLKRIEDVAEHLSTKLGVVVQPEKPSTQNKEKVYIAAALNRFASIAEAGFESWKDSMLLQYANDDLKQQLANKQMKQKILHLKKQHMQHSEQEAVLGLLQVRPATASSSLSTSSTASDNDAL